MARGCARIDSRLDTAKIGSADRVEVHHARLLAAIGVRKTFPHGLGQKRKSNSALPSSGLTSIADIARFLVGTGLQLFANPDTLPKLPRGSPPVAFSDRLPTGVNAMTPIPGFHRKLTRRSIVFGV